MLAYLIILLLLGALGFVTYHAVRWARIIFILEDDLTEALEVHERTAATLEAMLKIPMFFDSPEVKKTVDESMQNVKLCLLATQRVVMHFTQRSKQRYVRIDKTDNEDE